MAVKEKQEYIRLLWSQKDRRVFLETADSDKFSLTVEEAIYACSVYDKEGKALFKTQFDGLLDHLGSWNYSHREKINKALITLRDNGLLFLVITNHKQYDKSFDELLTELDLEIATAERFSEIKLSTQDLPLCDECNYSSFCNPDFTLEYTGINGD